MMEMTTSNSTRVNPAGALRFAATTGRLATWRVLQEGGEQLPNPAAAARGGCDEKIRRNRHPLPHAAAPFYNTFHTKKQERAPCPATLDSLSDVGSVPTPWWMERARNSPTSIEAGKGGKPNARRHALRRLLDGTEHATINDTLGRRLGLCGDATLRRLRQGVLARPGRRQRGRPPFLACPAPVGKNQIATKQLPCFNDPNPPIDVAISRGTKTQEDVRLISAWTGA